MAQQFQQEETFVFGSQPLGYYGLGSAGNSKADDPDNIIEDLQEKYGARLERMERLSKLAFRAALVNYLYLLELSAASTEGIPETLIDMAIDAVCPALWTDESKLCSDIQEIATLDKDSIEAFISALTAQLRYDFKTMEAA
ncbi:MAG: hypothetical protein KME46_21915 [Brasilonema angustatum HA4187-MV1]|jgi:glutamine synthetase type III|nr:hypothetical protein [Brasilonema angustatum HA4187-MV1]